MKLLISTAAVTRVLPATAASIDSLLTRSGGMAYGSGLRLASDAGETLSARRVQASGSKSRTPGDIYLLTLDNSFLSQESAWLVDGQTASDYLGKFLVNDASWREKVEWSEIETKRSASRELLDQTLR